MQEVEGFGLYAPIHARALPYLDTRDNEIHIVVSFGFALQLLAEYPAADEEVVLPAIILHDIGWKMIPVEDQRSAHGPNMTRPDLQRLHEVEGARLANEILSAFPHLDARRAEIVEIIDGHDTRLDPLSLNDQLVKDADKLWRFSQPGAHLASRRFDTPWSEWLDWLEARIEVWMYTAAGHRLARSTLERTRLGGEPSRLQ